MTTIEAQLELERHMRERGADNYEKAQAAAEQQGRGAETQYARKLMREFMLPLIEALDTFINERKAGMRGKIRPLLSQCPSEKAMYMAMQALFNHFTMEAPVAFLAAKIGRMVEDEIRFTKFQELYKEYYDEIKRDFARKGTKDYRYMHRVLTHKANEHTDHWVEWSQAERCEVGMKLLDIILQNTDLIQKIQFFERGKTRTLIAPTPAAKEWIDKHSDVSRFMWPDKMPCIIPPDDWTDLYQGGYYSPELRSATPFLKTQNKRHKKFVLDSDLAPAMAAVNTLQAVPWEVNHEVLDVMRIAWAKGLSIGMPSSQPLEVPPCPIAGLEKDNLTEAQQEAFTDWKHEAAEIHTQERERVSKSYQVSRILRLASKYSKHPAFYYVWYADFRGRLYSATAGFSPQGPDLGKGLLRFRNAKRVGERGWYWLRVHGANRFGYDKVTYDDRVKWVDENREHFVRAANDPIGNTDVWGSADKPWQFLAFLFEYRDALALEALGHSVEDFMSRLPIGLDGSCNGLQNFSAMLRDSVGGKATNLVPSDLPADIYSEVARVCTEKLRNVQDDPMARRWLDFCAAYGKGSIPRSMAKRPVMTLPYGATRQSCTQYIFESLLDTDREFFEGNFKAACWLTPYLWESIGDVVIAARSAMDWLQKCAGQVSKANVPVYWKAHDGFPAYQGTVKIKTFQIETQLAGRFQLKIGKFTDDMDSNKQRLGVAPNFVHSCDSAHMREVIRRAKDHGIVDLAMIHDDYGTHAADTDTLHQIIREAFVDIYEEFDPLAQFSDMNADTDNVYQLPAMPTKGSLDIRQVLDSRYFFG